MKFIGTEFLRFALIGGVNSAATYLLYLMLLLVLPYMAAYTISYAMGILISYLLNSLFVFRTPLMLKKAVQFPLIYFIQYTFGAVALFILVEVLTLDAKFAPLAVLAISLPVSFGLTRFVLKGRISGAR